jgi:hypothetical protein
MHFDDVPTITELPEDQMGAITVQMEDGNDHPSGNATLKEVFDDETKTCTCGAFELCGSVF